MCCPVRDLMSLWATVTVWILLEISMTESAPPFISIQQQLIMTAVIGVNRSELSPFLKIAVLIF